jgi:maleate cis-trans isomerase
MPHTVLRLTQRLDYIRVAGITAEKGKRKMTSLTWRGTVGVVKPSYESGTLVEFIRLLPEGIGVIPLYLGLKEHSEQEYLDALDRCKTRVAELARIGVDLVHPEGAPPFLIRGLKAEQETVRNWEKQYQIPIITSPMTQTAALRAMGMKKFLGVTFHDQRINDMFARYFSEAGFNVIAIEEMPVGRERRQRLSSEEIYLHIKKLFLKHPSADGIYLQGSGTWRAVDVVALEEDLGVPVIHPMAARVWCIQKRLHIRVPVSGAGSLLQEMP